jgi:Transglutaminase-like superfamily
MCLVQSNIRGINSANWDGDVIIQRPIVPSSRSVVGTRFGKQYDIDVREFLVTEHNALIRKTLREEIRDYLKTLPGYDLDLFQSRTENSFDYRAFVISSFVSERIAYKSRKWRDPWQFPDETLFIKSGDCEDRAFLIASLMIGAGISPYNIRVVLGKVRITKNNKPKEFDHMWVMYKTEAGQWILIEPLKTLNPVKRSLKKFALRQHNDLKKLIIQKSQVVAEYLPSFLFNDSHLWAVTDYRQQRSFDDLLSLRKKWKKFNPKFAGEVHQNILHAALAGVDERLLNALDQYFSRAVAGIFGPIVDDIDRRQYNPLDHFDNGYIKEGWDMVEERLKIFKQHNTRNLDSFALAAHAAADFYAHSSYTHFAKINMTASDPEFDYVELFDRNMSQLESEPDYSASKGFDLTSGKFSINKKFWDINKRPGSEIAKRWKGQLISGRYAQEDDTQPGLINQFIEGRSRIPEELLNKKDSQGKPDFPDRGSLPHHNEIAVDEKDISDKHKLYKNTSSGRSDRMSYENQFRWRRNSAIRHVRKIFVENWNLTPLNLTPLP